MVLDVDEMFFTGLLYPILRGEGIRCLHCVFPTLSRGRDQGRGRGGREREARGR